VVSSNRVESDACGESKLSRQRLARLAVALLLVSQVIGSVLATIERGWPGLGISLIAAPTVLAFALSFAIPPAIALAVVGVLGIALFSISALDRSRADCLA
jgi:hypothetical protein